MEAVRNQEIRIPIHTPSMVTYIYIYIYMTTYIPYTFSSMKPVVKENIQLIMIVPLAVMLERTTVNIISLTGFWH